MIDTPFLSQFNEALNEASCPLRLVRSMRTCWPPTSCWPMSGSFSSGLEATNLNVVGTTCPMSGMSNHDAWLAHSTAGVPSGGKLSKPATMLGEQPPRNMFMRDHCLPVQSYHLRFGSHPVSLHTTCSTDMLSDQMTPSAKACIT